MVCLRPSSGTHEQLAPIFCGYGADRRGSAFGWRQDWATPRCPQSMVTGMVLSSCGIQSARKLRLVGERTGATPCRAKIKVYKYGALCTFTMQKLLLMRHSSRSELCTRHLPRKILCTEMFFVFGKPELAKLLCEDSGADVVIDAIIFDSSLVARLGGQSAPLSQVGTYGKLLLCAV